MLLCTAESSETRLWPPLDAKSVLDEMRANDPNVETKTSAEDSKPPFANETVCEYWAQSVWACWGGILRTLCNRRKWLLPTRLITTCAFELACAASLAIARGEHGRCRIHSESPCVHGASGQMRQLCARHSVSLLRLQPLPLSLQLSRRKVAQAEAVS